MMFSNDDLTPLDVSTPLNAALMLGKAGGMTGGLIDEENHGETRESIRESQPLVEADLQQDPRTYIVVGSPHS